MALGGRAFPIAFAGLLALSGLGAGLAWGGSLQEQWTLAARYTARAAFPIFLLTYSASSLVRLWPDAGWQAALRRRRQWGLGFALAHTIHLGALATALRIAGETLSARALIGGGLAYGLIYLMALTSNDWSQRVLGLWWKRLHTAGIHWVWFVFAITYFGRLADPERWVQGAIFFPLCLAAFGLRIAAALSARRRRELAA